MEGIKIDGNTMYKRIEKIYKVWTSETKIGNSFDSFVILRGKHVESDQNSFQPKTSLFHEYLLGYEFTEALILFTRTKVIFFLGQKKKTMLENALKPSNYKGPNVEFLLRNIAESNEEALSIILKEMANKGITKIGKLIEEPGIGNLLEEWKKLIETSHSRIELVDCSIFIDEIFAVKEPEELEHIKVASKYACFIMETLNKRFENIIDDDKKVSHVTISNEVKRLTEKPAFQNKFKEKYKIPASVDFQLLEVSSNPVIQSGGNYDLSPTSPNDNRNISSDVIICKVNTRYKDYNANIIRSFMIDADKTQQNHYKVLYEAFNFLVCQMNEGNKISSIYDSVKEFILLKDQSLNNSIPDNFGYGLGLEFDNKSLLINKNNDRKLQNGMCFNVILSLSDLISEKGFKYSLQISDTLSLKAQTNQNFTYEVSKNLSDIYYNMDEEEEKNGKEEYENKMIVDRHGKKSTRRNNVQHEEKAKETQKRKDHQLELLTRKNLEFKERMLGGSSISEEVTVNKKNFTNIKSYNNKSLFPSEIKQGKIFVDEKHFTVILPVFKMMVPFHISLIKNVSKSEESPFSCLRINFVTPISGFNNIAFGDQSNLNQPAFIKDLTYKSKDNKNIANLFKQIKDLIKKLKEHEERDKTDVVIQENLILMKGKKIVLNNVSMRPNLSARKTTGVLEAHQNGFRFISNKGEKFEIIYKNIKHAFYQPCENELIVLIHFHLKNPLLIGKKKQLDIQFYREAGSQADDLDLRRRGNDYEEYETELKERQMREKINEEFAKFTKEVEEDLKAVEFDVPYRDLAFQGVPNKSNVTLIPTAFCLVSLIELPFFVITLDEIELVYFERVSHSIKNFDMVFVYKDLNRAAHRLGTIPMENLEMIKSWLDDCDILFSEGLYNINWVKIIQKIKRDPESFLQEGGWGFLHDDAEEGGVEEEEVDQDSAFEESEYEEEESEYSDDGSQYSDSDVEGGDEDLSEEGLSWDELEKHAMKEDKERLKRHGEEEQKNASKNIRKRGKK